MLTAARNYNYNFAERRQRHTPNLAFYDTPSMPASALPFEHVLLAANELESDVWINVPATASAPSICRSDPDGDHTKCTKSQNCVNSRKTDGGTPPPP